MGSKGSQTTTTQTQPNPAAQQSYYDLLSRAGSVASLPYTGYSGELVAPVNAQQQAGISDINQNAGFAAPYIGAASNYAVEGAAPISGDDISRYLNPFTNQVVNATQAQFANMNAQQQQQVLGNAAAQGALGGDRVGVTQANLAGQQQLAQAPVIAGLESQGYSQAVQTALAEQQAKSNAAYSLGNLGVAGQQAALSGAGAMIQGGNLQQQTQQQLDAAMMQQFLAQQGFPYAQTQWLAGINTGVGSQMGGTSQTTAPQPSLLGQMLGLGTVGLGVAGQAGVFKPSTSSADGGAIKGFDSGGWVMPYSDTGYIPGFGGLTKGPGAPAAPKVGGQQQSQSGGIPGMGNMSWLGSAFGGGSAGAGSAAATSGAGLEAGSAGLAEGAGEAAAGAGIADTAAASTAGAGIIDALPFLAFLKHGGKVPGFAAGGMPDAPSLGGFAMPSPGGAGPGGMPSLGGAPTPTPAPAAPQPGLGTAPAAPSPAPVSMPAPTPLDAPMAAPAPTMGPPQGLPPAPIQGLNLPMGGSPIMLPSSMPQVPSMPSTGGDSGLSSFSFLQPQQAGFGTGQVPPWYGGLPAPMRKGGRVGYQDGGDVTVTRGPQGMSEHIADWLHDQRLPASFDPEDWYANPVGTAAVARILAGGAMSPNVRVSQGFKAAQERQIPGFAEGGDVLDEPIVLDPAATQAWRDRTDADIATGVSAQPVGGFGQADGDLLPANSSITEGPQPIGGVSYAPTSGAAAPQGSIAGFNVPGQSSNLWPSLMAAGFGMLASKSPNAGVAIGEGGMQGLGTYSTLEQQRQQQAHQTKTEALNERKVNLEAQRLADTAEKARQELDLHRQQFEYTKQKTETPFGWTRDKEGKLTPVPGGPHDPAALSTQHLMQQGWRMTPDGKMEFIPGGPADPATIKAASEAKGENWKPTFDAQSGQYIWFNSKTGESKDMQGRPLSPPAGSSPAVPGVPTVPAPSTSGAPEPVIPSSPRNATAGTPAAGEPVRVASMDPNIVGVVRANSSLVESNQPFNYRQDSPYVEKGMQVPQPKAVGGKSSEAIKQAGEYWLQTGKLPAGFSIPKGNNPMAAMQADAGNSAINYGSALAISRGLDPKEVPDQWRAAPGYMRFVLGPAGQQTVSLGTAMRHLDTMQQLADAWNAYSKDPTDNNLRVLNQIKAGVARQFGAEAGTNLQMAARIVGPEIIKAIGIAGGGTGEERVGAASAFTTAESPAQIAGAIATAKHLMLGQLQGKQGQASASGVSDGQFKKLVGEREYDMLRNIDHPGGGAPTSGATTPAAGKPATVIQNGHTYTLQPDGTYR